MGPNPEFRHRLLILKADDFGRGVLVDGWRRFVDLCFNWQIVPSIGIVAADFLRCKPAQAHGRYLVDALDVEFWNHSFSHQDLTRLTAAQRKKDTIAAQQAIADVLGVTPTVYGPPFNHANQESIDDVQEVGGFRGFYFADGLVDPGRNIPRAYFTSPEMGTQFLRPVSYEYFLERFARQRQLSSALVMQVHPAYWSGECFREFEKTLRFLISHHNYQPLTAREFLLGRSVLEHHPAATLGPGSLLATCELIYENSETNPRLDGVMNAADRSYYFGRLERGTTRITRFLVDYGLLSVSNPPGSAVVVDIGAGVGNWALAAAAASPAIHAIAIDANHGLMDYMRSQVSRHIDMPRCDYVGARAERLPLKDAGADYVLSNNAVNYMPLDHALSEMARVLKPGTLALIGLQNELHPVIDLLRHLAERNDAAVNRIDRIFRTAARRYGLTGQPYFINYWTDHELVTAAMYAGLQPLLRGISLPEDYGELFGIPVLWGYIFTRSIASKKRAELLREGQGSTAADVSALISAGASDLAATNLCANPGLAPSVGNLAALAKQLMQQRGLSVEAAVEFFERAGVEIASPVRQDLVDTAPALAGGEWDRLAETYVQSSPDAAICRLCCAWFAAIKSDSRRERPCNTGTILDPLFDIGMAIRQSDETELRSAVTALFASARRRSAALELLAGPREIDPEYAIHLEGMPDQAVIDAREEWLKSIFRCPE